MKLDISVEKEILAWIMEHADVSTPQKSLDLLQKWYAQEKVPSFKQIEEMSRKTRIPFGYFFLKTPPQEKNDLLEFRTLDSVELLKPSRNLLDSIHNMEMVQDWVSTYLQNQQAEPLPFVGKLNIDSEIQEALAFVYKALDLEKNWSKGIKSTGEKFRILRGAISNAGVLVMMNGIVGSNTSRPLDIFEFRAFCLLDPFAPLIFINGKDSDNGKLFSLLHEFVHVCIGKPSLYNRIPLEDVKVSKTEQFCNAVAAELLLPQEAFMEKWSELPSSLAVFQKIETLAKIFCCSRLLVARRALDKKLISKKEYAQVAQYSKASFQALQTVKKSSGGDYYRTGASRLDKHFFRMLNEALEAGSTSYTEAFRLTGSSAKSFQGLRKEILGSPA